MLAGGTNITFFFFLAKYDVQEGYNSNSRNKRSLNDNIFTKKFMASGLQYPHGRSSYTSLSCFELPYFPSLKSYLLGAVHTRGGGGGGGTPYNGLYGEAPPERGTFFRLEVCERVGISQVQVWERVGKTAI